MSKIKNIKYYIGIIIIASLLYVPLTGKVHLFDWDEINFAESAREMIETGDYLTVQIDYRDFWEKPPFFIWIQAVSMNIFGINEFAARFSNAICGIITLLVLFNIGTRIKNKKFGLLWVLSHGASVLPFLYFKSGIIDPWFNLFIFLAIHQVILFYKTHKEINIILSAVFIAFALLTKGPAGFMIFGITVFVFLIIKRFQFKVNIKQIIYFLLLFIIIGGSWFILLIIDGKSEVIVDFIRYQVKLFTTKDAGHGGFLLYHFIVLLVGVFPASVFAIDSLIKRNGEDENISYYSQWMKILFWVVLILFTVVRTKIVHYSSMCYFPLSFLSASYLFKWSESSGKHPIYQSILFYSISSVFLLFAIALPLAGIFKKQIIASGIIKDKFVIGNLQADVVWTGFEILSVIFLLAGILLYLILIRKKQFLKSLYFLFGGVVLFTFAFLILNIKKIEGYSQKTVIDFYKSLVGEDCYIKTMRYKSYAHYFYFKGKKPENKRYYDNKWMLTGDIDKTVYFVSRVSHQGLVEKYAADDLIFIEEKNGFLFHKREPKKDD